MVRASRMLLFAAAMRAAAKVMVIDSRRSAVSWRPVKARTASRRAADFGLVGEERVDEGSFDFQGGGEESVSQEGVGVAAAVASLVGDGPGQIEGAFAAAHGGPGGGADRAEGDGPMGAGEALVAGEAREVGIGPLAGGLEGEDVSDCQGGVIGGGAGPDDLQRVSVFFPEAKVESRRRLAGSARWPRR